MTDRATNAAQPAAIVTGGSRGLGRALAAELRAADWQVVIDGRHEPSLNATAKAIGARAVRGDVTDDSHRRDLVTAARTTGRIHLLINNAGALGPSPLPQLADLGAEDLRRLHEANVVAPLALTQLCLPDLRASGGAIVNITSDAAVEGYEGWGGYGSTKAAVEAISRVLAEEEPGIRVWWVDPGDLRTEMHQAAFPGEDISDRPLPESVAPGLLRLLQTRPPSGRIRLPDLVPSEAAARS